MERIDDQQYMKNEQYKDASNLDARIALHVNFSTNPQGLPRWEFDQYLDLPAAATLLELGTGPASLWPENLDRVPSGWTITLSDLSPGMLDEARQKLGAQAELFTYREIDAQSIPFADDTFDAIIANHMLYHVPDIPRGLAEIRRVLKPGGRLFAVTNGEKHMIELVDLQQTLSISTWRDTLPILPFNLENGAELLKPHFASVTIRHYEDALDVTDADAIVAYTQSMTESMKDLSNESSLRMLVEQTMQKNNGIFQIQKSTGMFVASN